MCRCGFATFTILLVSFGANHVIATWWYLSQVDFSDRGVFCDNIPGLVGRQREVCKAQPRLMTGVVRGLRLGIRECQKRFKDNRWNCSTSEKDPSVFGKSLINKGSRESAFVHAISSAAVVHAVTKSCSRGAISQCACSSSHVGLARDWRGDFNWGGCSDDVRFGRRFARSFINGDKPRSRDSRALMNRHNNRVGMGAVNQFTRSLCKCHGVSGSCSIRTCWRKMHHFRRVGRHLRTRYTTARKVTLSQDGGNLIMADTRHRWPARSDLVFLDRSPNYCERNNSTGAAGTAGRECNRTSLAMDGCDLLCCGRGHDTRIIRRTRQCQCQFQWCCSVKCNTCEELVTVYTCKNPHMRTHS